LAKYYPHVREVEIGGKCSTRGIRQTLAVFLSGDMNGTDILVDVGVDGLMVL
jgi:hypothetical protein